MQTSTMRFPSVSAEARFYIVEALEDGLPHTANELRSYVLKRHGNPAKCTRGVFSGVFRDLIAGNQGAYISPDRGVYQKASPNLELSHPKAPQGSDFSARVMAALSSASSLIEEACTTNLLTVSADDLQLAQTVQEIKKSIDNLRQKLEKSTH